MSETVLLAMLGAGGVVAVLLTWGRDLTTGWQADTPRQRADWIAEIAALRARIDGQNTRIAALEDTIDQWQGRYYELRVENARLETENQALTVRVTELEAEVGRLQQRLDGC